MNDRAALLRAPEPPVARDRAPEADADVDRSAAARRPRSTPPSVLPRVASLDADAIAAQQRARRARRLVGALAERSDRLAARLERQGPSGAPPRLPRDDARTLVADAMRLVADERYPEAIERLEHALARTPEPRVRVLLCVVQARQALTERDFPRARARYEAVLRLDPSNVIARRELRMLSTLVG